MNQHKYQIMILIQDCDGGYWYPQDSTDDKDEALILASNMAELVGEENVEIKERQK